MELDTTVLPSEFQTLVNAPLKKKQLIIVLEWPWVCGGGRQLTYILSLIASLYLKESWSEFMSPR